MRGWRNLLASFLHPRRITAAALLALWCGTANAGDVLRAYSLGSSGTATFTATTPTVVTVATWATPTSTIAAECPTTLGAPCATPVYFTNSGGALPTGITARTIYYIVPNSVSGTSFSLATTAAKALANNADVNASNTGSGTQTGVRSAALASNTSATLTALNLPVGEWRCDGSMVTVPASGTTTSQLVLDISSTDNTSASSDLATNSFSILQTALLADKVGGLVVGPRRQLLTRPTIMYLVGAVGFGVSNMDAYGMLQCERVP